MSTLVDDSNRMFPSTLECVCHAHMMLIRDYSSLWVVGVGCITVTFVIYTLCVCWCAWVTHGKRSLNTATRCKLVSHHANQHEITQCMPSEQDQEQVSTSTLCEQDQPMKASNAKAPTWKPWLEGMWFNKMTSDHNSERRCWSYSDISSYDTRPVGGLQNDHFKRLQANLHLNRSQECVSSLVDITDVKLSCDNPALYDQQNVSTYNTDASYAQHTTGYQDALFSSSSLNRGENMAPLMEYQNRCKSTPPTSPKQDQHKASKFKNNSLLHFKRNNDERTPYHQIQKSNRGRLLIPGSEQSASQASITLHQTSQFSLSDSCDFSTSSQTIKHMHKTSSSLSDNHMQQSRPCRTKHDNAMFTRFNVRKFIGLPKDKKTHLKQVKKKPTDKYCTRFMPDNYLSMFSEDYATCHFPGSVSHDKDNMLSCGWDSEVKSQLFSHLTQDKQDTELYEFSDTLHNSCGCAISDQHTNSHRQTYSTQCHVNGDTH